MDGHTLALTFDTSDPEFARGVEVGRLWELLKVESDEFSEDVHASNAEMVLRIAESVGRSVRSVDLDTRWVRVTFAEARGAS